MLRFKLVIETGIDFTSCRTGSDSGPFSCFNYCLRDTVFRGWRRRMACHYQWTTLTVPVSTHSHTHAATCFLHKHTRSDVPLSSHSSVSASAVVNGNSNSKVSPESTCSWAEDRCNGHAPGRFSSPASGLSGFSSSVMSATSESALSTQSGYSSGRDGEKHTL